MNERGEKVEAQRAGREKNTPGTLCDTRKPKAQEAQKVLSKEPRQSHTYTGRALKYNRECVGLQWYSSSSGVVSNVENRSVAVRVEEVV